MSVHKVIIDTDPGIDDAMAILYACLEPKIELVGLTSIFGNVTTEIATRNALALLELAKVDAPVARGAERPLVQEPKEVAWFVHGHEGFGDVPPITPAKPPIAQSAHEFICNQINQNPGEIILCPVGPLTNLALALEHDPSIVDEVKSVTVMGGSLDDGGNATKFAEANIWQDPHAAEKVFAANWQVNMIGLDVTHRILCSPEEFAALPETSPKLGGFLNDAAQFYFDFHLEKNNLVGCHMHDPAAVISIVAPELFSFDETPVDVTLEGEEIGETVRSTNNGKPHVKVATSVDSDAVRAQFLDRFRSGF